MRDAFGRIDARPTGITLDDGRSLHVETIGPYAVLRAARQGTTRTAEADVIGTFGGQMRTPAVVAGVKYTRLRRYTPNGLVSALQMETDDGRALAVTER